MNCKTSTAFTYPPVPEEPLSKEYVVSVNGKRVPVYQALLDGYGNSPLQMDDYYSFASFDCEGPVTVVIESSIPLTELSIRSHDQEIVPELEGNRATFVLETHGNFLVERNGHGRKDPLLLFANPLEADAPEPDDPDVVYFGPGFHDTGLIELTHDQTLYIHGGAIVFGRVEARGENIRILGRGLLCNAGETYFRKHLILFQDCTNARVEGIVLRKQSQHWTLVAKDCDDVTVSNVKICGSFYGNDDGIDPVNVRNMTIDNCFIRTKDDCIAIKGMDDEGRSNCENITITRTMMWTDQCCTILIGDECRADYMRNIAIRDCFVPYLSHEGYPKKFLMLHACEDTQMENTLIENIEIRGEGQDRNYIEMTCEFNQYCHKKVAGHIRNIRLKHVHLTGKDGGYFIKMQGFDEEHGIEDVRFEDCTINGKPIAGDYPNLLLGKFVSGPGFGPRNDLGGYRTMTGQDTMTPRERWEAVLRREKPDRVPMDYWATGEATRKLLSHLGCDFDEAMQRLHIDIPLGVGGQYVGPEVPEGENLFGLKYKAVDYGTGTYNEVISAPLAEYESVEEIEKNYSWPSPEWWDYSHLPEQIKGLEHRPIKGGGSEPFLMYCQLRGLEQAMMDLVLYPEIVDYCLGKLFDLACESTRRIYEAIPGRVLFSYVAEDLGSQHSLLMSREHMQRFLFPHMKRMMDLAHSAGVYVFTHSDGAIREVIPDLIELGMDVLNPIQWRLPGMEREGLKEDFGDRIIFHGAVDNQQTLPFGTVDDVRQEVEANLRILGAGGGYILGPCHNIQAVSPPENIVAMYEAGYELGRST